MRIVVPGDGKLDRDMDSLKTQQEMDGLVTNPTVLIHQMVGCLDGWSGLLRLYDYTTQALNSLLFLTLLEHCCWGHEGIVLPCPRTYDEAAKNYAKEHEHNKEKKDNNKLDNNIYINIKRIPNQKQSKY